MIPALSKFPFQISSPHSSLFLPLSSRLTAQTYLPPDSTDSGEVQAEKVLLWDRKTEGGFPETKVLKQRVRDIIDPKKDLGHSDVGGKKKDAVKTEESSGKKVAEVKVDAPKIDNVKVDGNVERNAEEMVKDLEVDEPGGEEVKRNPDGTVCEDCR